MLTTKQLRQNFLDYFIQHGHTSVPSGSLIPGNDPTLLFTNAGMVPFKDVFLGQETRNYVRATSSQRCVRAGGKHNDLDNVGFTARHHTFFEMLGNFSFGDYFKQEAIEFAWHFLTQVLALPKEKLWVSVFEKDDETANIWLNEMKIDPTRFSRCGEDSNFWSMGDTGPCGPCTEVFYDHGADIAGGPPGSPDEDGDRYIEIWNLVFMQYERQTDGSLKPLPKPSVDTGMGLERIAAVMQGVHNNYDIDLFQGLIKKAAALTHTNDMQHTSLKVIADHIRSCAFLIVDGVRPSNEGRGYVLRRIIRRAARHGHKLGMQQPFFHKLVGQLVTEMGEAYPELTKNQKMIEEVLLGEEQKFLETLSHGLQLLEQAITSLKNNSIPGDVIFKLYDTYGFPFDLTADIAREKNLALDQAGFDACMETQRGRSQASSKFAVDYTKQMHLPMVTTFTGYESLEDNTTVVGLLQGNKEVAELKAGEEGYLILDITPFYAESGGQVGDQGKITASGTEFKVLDTKKVNQAYVHYGKVTKGQVKKSDEVTATVDAALRQATVLNHSATHLLHAALRKILGAHVVQKGSLVAPDKLRFDFSHTQALSAEELVTIEARVNQEIRENHCVETKVTTPEAAQKEGAMALFGEKYGDKVRVLKMGEFSLELCGGTHVKRTGDIGLFKVINETGIASGVRRIEAVTGDVAMQCVNEQEQRLKQVAQALKVKPEELTSKIKQLQEQIKQNEKEVRQLKKQLASGGTSAQEDIKQVSGVSLLVKRLEGFDVKALREMLDHFKNKMKTGVVVLVSVDDDKIQFIVGVSKDLTQKIKAGELAGFIAEQIGGKGGGRPDMAQGGGHQVENLDKALASIEVWLGKI